jgi:hypothetical protein
MQKFYVYVHCRPDGSPFYVGKGIGQRAFKLLGSERNRYHARIVAKYGAKNILIHTYNCESEQAALDFEVELIAHFKPQGIILANMTDGGEGLSNPSPEIRSRLSDAAKLMWQDDEYRAKTTKAQSLGKIGNKNAVGNSSALGNTFSHTEDAKKKIGKAHIGNKHRLGSKASPETKARMSASHVGIKKTTHKSPSAADVKKMKRLHSKGLSYSKIVDQIGYSIATVHDWINKQGE